MDRLEAAAHTMAVHAAADEVPIGDVVPAGQEAQYVEKSLLNFPAGHPTHSWGPPVNPANLYPWLQVQLAPPPYALFGQFTQPDEEVAPDTSEYFPAGHDAQLLLDVAAIVVEYLPCGQSEHPSTR